jgi:hypothetical protein
MSTQLLSSSTLGIQVTLQSNKHVRKSAGAPTEQLTVSDY